MEKIAKLTIEKKKTFIQNAKAIIKIVKYELEIKLLCSVVPNDRTTRLLGIL